MWLIRILALSIVLFLGTIHSDERTKPIDVRLPSGSPIPIVRWHGIGSSTTINLRDARHQKNNRSHIHDALEQNIKGVYIVSLRIGNSPLQEIANSFFMDCNQQVKLACEIIRSDPKLQNGYNALGMSQGGLLLRAVAQRCPEPPMFNLITYASPHNGVYGLPWCSLGDIYCNLARQLLTRGVYTRSVQQSVAQAQYWLDPLDVENYRSKSLFLADINNERTPRKPEYSRNLRKLKNFVMIQFENDTIVNPKESELFGGYVPGQAKVIQRMNETRLYKEDWIGLRTLDEAGKVKTYTVPGQHLENDVDWFASEIIPKYLI